MGPTLAGICLSIAGAPVHLARTPVLIAQGIVGAMIAGTFPPETFAEIARDWPLFMFGTLSTVVASSALGWFMMRGGLLPGTTAIWGSAPGAASVMTFMSAHYGADMRLVTLMQYTRVVLCTVSATLVARALGAPTSSAGSTLFSSVSWTEAASTLAFVCAGVWIAVRLRIPGGAMLLPMLMGIALNFSGLMHVTLPPVLLAAAYALLGWAIGMRFTVDVVAHSVSLLPRLLLSVLALIVICALLGWILAMLAGVSFLTGYLATNPGGADSVALIASGLAVDVPFVMAMQLARFLVVMVAGPALARLLSRSARKPSEELERRT